MLEGERKKRMTNESRATLDKHTLTGDTTKESEVSMCVCIQASNRKQGTQVMAGLPLSAQTTHTNSHSLPHTQRLNTWTLDCTCIPDTNKTKQLPLTKLLFTSQNTDSALKYKRLFVFTNGH